MRRWLHLLLFLSALSSQLSAVLGQSRIKDLPVSTQVTTNTRIVLDDATYGVRSITWPQFLDVIRTNANAVISTNNGVIAADSGSGTNITIIGGTASDLTLVGPVINELASITLTPSAEFGFGTENTGSLVTVGDSFTFSASATHYSNSYPYKLAQTLGLTLTNVSNGSSMIPDANWQIVPGWVVTNTSVGAGNVVGRAPAEITEDSNTSVLIGFNDVRTSTTTTAGYRLGLDHLLHYLAIPDSAKRFAQDPDASTGTWTTNNWWGGGDKAAFSSSGTLTFSNVIGTEIYIGYMGWATTGWGSISATVDGTSVGSAVATSSAAYGNREYISGTDPVLPDHMGPYGNGKIDFCPHLITVTGLGLRAHTVVITVTGNPTHVLWVAGNGFKRTPKAGPNVFVGTIPRQSPWTGAGTDALQGSFNSQLVAAVAACRAAGLRVVLAPTGEFYDPTTEQDTDGVHPNNTGHATLAQAFESVAGMDLTTFGGLSISSASALAAGSFTSLSVSGASSLVGNITGGGRLLILPTATSGGTSSRFGFGSVSGSSVQINHSDTGVDRLLIVGGNTISSTVNSTGAAANLSIGSAGSTTTIPGPAAMSSTLTVSGAATMSTTLGVSGITTLSDRLLILPTPSGVGASSRFGQGSAGNSSISFLYADTDLDRLMQISGDSILVTTNSNGGAATMTLGQSGATTAIAGTATIGQTLAVTGNSTFGPNGTPFKDLRFGRATLSSGVATVTLNPVATSDRFISLTHASISGPVGRLAISNIISNTSFQIVSTEATDNGNVDWAVVTP